MMIKKTDNKRYQLSTRAQGLGSVSTLEEAQELAISLTKDLLVPVRVFDRFAHVDQVDLWEVDLWEVEETNQFLVPLRTKRRRAS